MSAPATCPASTATGAAGQLFTMLLQSVMAAPCNLSNPDMWPKEWNPSTDDNPQYDFIVVGAGSAGSVVAHRLAENKKWKVLLIEAGGDPPITSEVPSLFFNLQKTEIDWGYYTEKGNQCCLGYKKQRCYWPRGKVLGGTSAMNGMVYLRGNRRDFDNWEKLGNPGWGFEDVLKYFKLSEDMRAPHLKNDKKFHAQGGDLKVDNYYDDKNPLRETILQAASELGYDYLQDINAEKHIGFARLQGTLDHGTRCSAAKAFLTHKQENLHVVKHAKVTKILIDATKKQANGVQFIQNGRTFTASSAKEIIISGGAINSPQLLMLSGVGPKEHLEELGIPVVADLPVGRNLQDHLFIPIWVSIYKNAKDISTESVVDNIYDYFAHHDGALSGIGVTDVAAFVNTVNVSSLYPNTEFHYIYYPGNDTLQLPKLMNALGYVEATATSIVNANKEGDIMLFMPSILNPRSTGEIKLKSSNHSDYPKIYPNYLDDEEDMNIALRSTKLIKKITLTKAMQKIGAEFLKIDLPNCRDYVPFEDDYWKCFIRNTGTTEYHPSSSVKMGSAEDPTAVVDSRLRVHGIQGLRVADASIMPRITSGNINAPTIMIGEKAAAMIKQDWQPSRKRRNRRRHLRNVI